MQNISDKLIVALDVDTLDKARRFVDRLYPAVKLFKIGSQLFTAYGPEAVKMVAEKKGRVFLDLKFYDIPNTVAHAVRACVRLKVKMLTLHILGLDEMLKGAVRAASDEAKRRRVQRPLLLGVTVLTSQKAGRQNVLRLAKKALGCGLDGVVCSVHEAASVRKACGKDFIIATPGIRPKGALADDQKRVATAQEAMAAGANYLVVGRPILEARDPLRAVQEISSSYKQAQ